MAESPRRFARARTVATFAALLLLFFGPLAGAWLLNVDKHLWRPGGMQYGTLLTPVRPMRSLPATPPALDARGLRGHWTLLIVARDPAVAQTAVLLHQLHQLHVALGGNASRLRRVVVAEDSNLARLPADTPRDVTPEKAIGAPPRQIAQLLKSLDGDPQIGRAIVLVDPLGNIMMRYPAKPDVHRMLRDVQRLMRTSSIG